MKGNEDLFTRIGDLLTDGVLLYDVNTRRITYINATGVTLTGLQHDDGQEKIQLLWQQVMVQDRAYLMAQYHQTLKDSVNDSAEFGLIRDGQEKKYLRATACFVREKSLLAVFLRDITQAKEHEDYLVEFGAKKNTLLDTLTHNLSGALNLTRHLMAQAEKYADKAGTELQTFLELITKNNEASLKIIEDFLVYEHEKSPRIHIKAVRIDLVEKVGFVHQQLKISYPDRTFIFTSQQPELHITTDEVKLLQVINNLTSNALKFSSADKPIVIHIEANTDRVIISVSDQGIGIPHSLEPLIFLRQPNTGRPGLKGEASNGQGLFICKQMVELMGGSITFESTEGKGSIFRIALPYVLDSDSKPGKLL